MGPHCEAGGALSLANSSPAAAGQTNGLGRRSGVPRGRGGRAGSQAARAPRYPGVPRKGWRLRPRPGGRDWGESEADCAVEPEAQGREKDGEKSGVWRESEKRGGKGTRRRARGRWQRGKGRAVEEREKGGARGPEEESGGERRGLRGDRNENEGCRGGRGAPRPRLAPPRSRPALSPAARAHFVTITGPSLGRDCFPQIVVL